MRKIGLYFSLILGLLNPLLAQRGKHGALSVSALNVIVNEYTSLTSNATAGTNIINVANSNLNTNSRFASNLQVGDLIMIIQVQGISMKTFAVGPGQDSTYGEILSYQNCGNYEFAQVFAIPNGTSIQLDCNLMNNYSASPAKTQVIRVPRYSSLTVNAGASLTGDPWNGTIGGIITTEVNGASVINGSVIATGIGFRRGVAVNQGNFGGMRFVDLGAGYAEGGEKGEGIAGSQADYVTFYNGKHSRGAPANGGGGGNCHNAGGGGGANAGNPATWRGYGITNPTYATAYNLEFPGRAAIVSSGGGKGGYSLSNANINPLVNGPFLTTWSGDFRRPTGGFGGRPLDYSTGRIFLGGGGGAGEVNNMTGSNTGGHGGHGGGMIYFITFGNISGTGQIIANGNNGTTATGPAPFSGYNGNDAAGGGGGGGTIILNTTGTVSGVNILANGGLGGNQVLVKSAFAGAVNEAEGPGGGGGGGYIALSAGAPAQSVLGAISGTTNSNSMVNFPPNGATNGAPGLSGQSITLYTLSVNPVTVCVNNSATLNAISNNPTASFIWYNNLVGTTQIGTGAVFTTSVFTAIGTFTVFAETCPGFYRIPVLITVTNGPNLTASSSTICNGQTATLTASGATNYTWSTGATGSSITVNPSVNTVYTVTGGSSGCTNTITSSVTVNSAANINVFGATICAGQTATISAAPAISYTWNTGANTQSITVSPITTTSYVVNASVAGCVASNTAVVTVNSSPTLTVNNPTICSTQTAVINAAGATSYLWGDGSTASSLTVSPTSTSVFSFTGTTGGCSSVGNSTVTVNPNPTINVVGTSSVCNGQVATFTASGATTYTWNGGIVSNTFTDTPIANSIYSVQGTLNGCVTNYTVAVNVGTVLSISVNSDTICPGGNSNLTAISTATNFVWNTGATTNFINVTPTTTTIYSVTGNFGGCVGSSTAQVVVVNAPSVTISSSTICPGQTSTISVIGGTSYTWSTGSNASSIVVNPISSTSYTVFAVTGTNCSQSSTVPIIVSPPPNINVNSPSICNGGNVILTASGAATYTWLGLGNSTNTISVSPNSNTSYTVIGANGSCTAQAVSNVSVTNGGTLTLNSPVICEGQQTTIGTNYVGISYLWSNGATTPSITVSPNTNAVYTLQVISGSGCTVSATNTVFVNPAPTITISASALNICAGSTVNLQAFGSANYTWQPNNIQANSIVVSPTVSTTFFVTSSINNGCISSSSVPVIVDHTPTISINNVNNVCPNVPLNIYANGANTIEWTYNGNYYLGNPLTFTPTKNTVLVIKGYQGACSTFTSVNVNVSNLLASINAESNYVEYPGSLTFTNTSSNYQSVYWDFGNGQSNSNSNVVSSSFETPGKYLVTLIAKDENGCVDTLYYPIECGCTNPDLFIPNTFTPNGDGVNDEFKIYGGFCVEKFECVIFDRWGAELKTIKNFDESWDAFYKGKSVEVGVYNYRITSKLYNGKQISKTGHVTVLR